MRLIHSVLLLLVLTLPMIGCTSTQPAASSSGAPPTTAVSSVPQSPAPSSHAPATPISEPAVPEAPEEPEAPPEQQVLSATEATAQPVAEQHPVLEHSDTSEPMEENSMIDITLQVGGKNFSATLVNSEATLSFVKYFPMTVQMSELNRQEKFYDLPKDLPATATERPATIYSGDIMCWSGNTLVLFYSTFQNSYGGYVRLGTVDDPAGLAAALGSSGSVEVTWTLA